MKKFSPNQKTITILIITTLLMTVLTACSPKDQSTDTKSDTQNTVSKSLATPAPISDKASPVLTSPATSNEPSAEISSAPKPDTISIKYIGNSCFYITFPDGTRLVTDPYGSSYETQFGKSPIMESDVICLTHNHDDHTSGVNQVLGDPQIIEPEETGKEIKVGDVKITGYTSDHVAKMCANTIFVFQSGDFKVVDMGETDNIASKEAIRAVKDADVILAYAGEYGDVKNRDNFKTLMKLGIKVMIPQHYSNNPKIPFYGQPTIDKIRKEVPKDLPVKTTDEFIVRKDLKKQFVYLKTWGGY